MWDFIHSAQRDKVHVFDLLHVVSSHSIALPATEVLSGGSPIEYQADERAGVAWLSWRGSGR